MLTYEKKISLEKNLGFFEIELADLKKKRLLAAFTGTHEEQQKLDAEIAEVRQTRDRLKAELDGLENEFTHLAEAV